MTAQNITRVRAKLGLTQADLAQLLGVHAITVSKWERDMSAPTPYQRALLHAMETAASRDPCAGPRTVNVLKQSGIARALYQLLRSAFT